MNWQQICEDPQLRNLPYKIELNETGQLIMTPARLIHGAYQARIVRILAKILPSGECITECAINTPKGTKVADVAWFSSQRWEQVKAQYESPIAPEICVEILSPSNSKVEINTKKRLYFAAGAEEVWTCDEQGKLSFWNQTGELEQSGLAHGFPERID
ncbi:hypothetical protein THII_1408 [Thioploca ingrica]|uniref:Putative restriction endonuclease domain-containing protein n=1 Tax=Thioploca ingrica TaxID=40754 RepID=A0A090AKV5_9GAMM|nr:hypothetical protein THII_1408 [Thioploca ingrica]